MRELSSLPPFRSALCWGTVPAPGALAPKALREDPPPRLGTENGTLGASAALLKAVGFKLVLEGLNNCWGAPGAGREIGLEG